MITYNDLSPLASLIADEIGDGYKTGTIYRALYAFYQQRDLDLACHAMFQEELSEREFVGKVMVHGGGRFNPLAVRDWYISRKDD